MLVDVVHPSQHVGEGIGADGDHEAQPHRRAQRIATAHPVPHGEDGFGVDAEVLGLGGVGGDRREVLAGPFGPHGVSDPIPGGAGVGQGFDGGERLGHHDEQGPGRVQASGDRPKMGSVHIGQEPHVQIGMGE